MLSAASSYVDTESDTFIQKILVTPETSYAMSLMLTSYRYTVAESEIESWKAVKNITEIEGLKK